MAYVAPTLEQFRARFSEFGGVPDPVLTAMLLEADGLWVDARWSDRDRYQGALYYTAHLARLKLEEDANLEAFEEGETEQGEVETFVKSVAFDDRTVTFERKNKAASSSSASVRAVGSDDPLSQTSYGNQYLMLRRRNIGGPRVIL